VSLEAALARIQEIKTFSGVAAQPVAAQPEAGAFASALKGSTASAASSGPVGARMVSLAQAELAKGVSEGNGDNDSPDIARYRTSTKGAAAGAPWCAYFVSYIAKQAGAPIGSGGSGIGYVPTITNWAKQSGKFIAPGGQVRPGDIILFGGSGHTGIVEKVNRDGSLTTIEGNHSDRVDRVTRSKSEAVGFVRMG
jgi:hypothetical protein